MKGKSLKEQMEETLYLEQDKIMEQFDEFVKDNAKKKFVPSEKDIIKYYEKLYPTYKVALTNGSVDEDSATLYLTLEFTNKESGVITAFHITAHA